MTEKRYWKGLGPARKPSLRTRVDNKPRNNDQLPGFSNGSVSNNICRICSGDHNVSVISLENGRHIVTRPFPKEAATKVKSPGRILLDNIFWWEEVDV